MRLTAAGAPGSHSFATNRISRGWASVFLAAALALCFELDRVTGSAPLQHLYYVPIIFAALRFGARGALALAGAATVLYHVANPHLFSFSFHYEEADVVQIALFTAVGLVAAKLTEDARRLHHLAMTDDLTGLHNLRSFEARLKTMIRTARETGRPLSVLVLDLDRLKSLNDAHGHLAGAEAVQSVGRLVAAHVPGRAVACRYGGDEFVVALPDCTEPQAAAVAHGLGSAVNGAAPVLAGRQFPPGTLSISVGVACWRPAKPVLDGAPIGDEEQGEALFQAADAALYAAKTSGRNRVAVGSASTDVPPQHPERAKERPERRGNASRPLTPAVRQ